MNALLEKLGSNATTNAITIIDVGTLKEAFSLWAAEEKPQNGKRNDGIQSLVQKRLITTLTQPNVRACRMPPYT